MGLWKRFSDWRQGQAANQATETPEQALDRAIGEMGRALESAHAHFAELTTYERHLRAVRDKSLAEAERCESEARRHVLTGRDDLARAALERKVEHDRVASDYQKQWETQNAIMLALKAQIEALAGQQRDAVRNRDLFLARERAANAQMQMREALEAAQNLAPVQAIRETEARAVAEAELAGWIPSRPRQQPAPIDPETQFVALQEQVGVREQTAPPAPLPWFSEEGNSVAETKPDTVPPREVWFADEPKTVSEGEPVPPLWFDAEPQPSNNAVFASDPTPEPIPAPWFPEPSHGLPNENALAPGANRVLEPAHTYHISLGWEIARKTGTRLSVCAIL